MPAPVSSAPAQCNRCKGTTSFCQLCKAIGHRDERPLQMFYAKGIVKDDGVYVKKGTAHFFHVEAHDNFEAMDVVERGGDYSCGFAIPLADAKRAVQGLGIDVRELKTVLAISVRERPYSGLSDEAKETAIIETLRYNDENNGRRSKPAYSAKLMEETRKFLEKNDHVLRFVEDGTFFAY